MKKAIAGLIASVALYSSAFAESNSPYIDRLKNKLGPAEESPESYTEQQKREIPSKDPFEGYTERLKQSHPHLSPSPEGESYSEKQRLRLEPKDQGGAIQAVNEGRSELHLIKKGSIHQAFGMRVGASLNSNFDATSGVKGIDFASIYGGNFSPDLSFFYEYQPFHSEWFGNFGFIGMAGVSYYHGYGRFTETLRRATPSGLGEEFPLSSRTKFQFFVVPLSVALDYRFNLLRFVRPFIMAGPTLALYAETRSDSKKGNRGYSKAFFTTVGAAIPINWLSKESDWNLYNDYQIKRFSLTLEYSRMQSVASDVNFTISGILAGLTFEY